MQSSEPNSAIEPSQRYQRMANFLLAVVLRLEGVNKPSSTPQPTRTPDGIKQHDRPTQQGALSPVLSPVNSDMIITPTYATPKTSDTVSSSNISLKSQQSLENSVSLGQSEATDAASLTPKAELSPKQTPGTSAKHAPETPSVASKDSESSLQGNKKFGSCPCTLFYTPDANLNPRMFFQTAGGKFVTGNVGASPFQNTEYYSTPNPTFTKEDSNEIANEKDADSDLGDWKQMKSFFLSEASNLYRDAMRMTHSARLVEGVIYHSVAEMVVKDVLKNVRQKLNAEIFDESLTVNYDNRKSQRQQVQFKVPMQRGNGKREFVAPRQCTPFRPAPPAPQKISEPVSRIVYDDSDDQENLEEFMDVHKQLKCTVSSSELRRSNTESTSPKRHSSFTRVYQESPPVPFRLKATNPKCNRLLRKMVEKHFSGENATEKNEKGDEFDESISEMGDAKTEASLQVETRIPTKQFLSTTTQKNNQEAKDAKTEVSLKVDTRKPTKQFLSTTTQTDEEKDEIESDTSIQTRRSDTAVEGTMSVDREMQTDGLDHGDIDDAVDRRIDKLLSLKSGREQTSIPQTGDATVKKLESVDDLKNVTCANDIVTGSGDHYRQQARSVVMTAIYRAVSKLFVNSLMKEIGDKLGQDSSFNDAVFDRNTPNVPDSAKETLNIVSRTSSSDDQFRWLSSAFERAAASLIESSAQQSEFKWTPYRRDMSGPNRATGVSHHPKPDSRYVKVSKDDEETALIDQEVYISAESSNDSDEEFEDARSQNSDVPPLLQSDDDKEWLEAETRAASLVDDSTLKVLATSFTEFIIRTSLAKIAKDEVNRARNRFTPKPMSDDREVKWSDVIVVSETSSATEHDHTYVKSDIGGIRDSTTTIETVSDSLGESGFSDAQTSVSDLFNTEEEDMETIKDIVDGLMRRAVDVVIDGIKDDWGKFLEEHERETAKFATPDDSSESESGISASSSYHSVTSDLTDITLVMSEVEDTALTAGLHVPQQATSYETTCEEHDVRDAEAEKSDQVHDPKIPISFLKEQMTDVKALVAKFQQVEGDTSDTTSESGVLKKQYNQAEYVINEQQKRDATSGSDTMGEQSHSLNWIRISSRSQSGTTTHSEPRSDNSVIVTRSPSTTSDATEISRQSENVKPDEISVVGSSIPVSTSVSSESRISRSSLKREAESSTESDGERKRSRPRVKTHVFFWEKLSDRKKVKKIREKPIKPVTPAKETIHKFEEIARKSSSSSIEFKQHVQKHDKKPGMRRRIGEKLRLGATSKARQHKTFWKNKAFFSALENLPEKETSEPEHAEIKVHQRTDADDSIHIITDPSYGSTHEEQIFSRDEQSCEPQHAEIELPEGTDADDSYHSIVDSSHGSTHGDEIFSRDEQVSESQIEMGSEETLTSGREEEVVSRYEEVLEPQIEMGSEETLTSGREEEIFSRDEEFLEPQIEMESEEILTSGCEEGSEQLLSEHEYQADADYRSETGGQTRQFTDNATDEQGYESENSRINALVKPSKSEEEIQAWMEKCKKIKERTSLLLNKCAEGENLSGDGISTQETDKDATDIASLTSGPSRASSHDTGIRIFPFGVPITGDQIEMFNPDQHIAALEQDSDWVASSDDNISTQIEAVMKESSDTLKEIDKIKSRDIIEIKATNQEEKLSQLASEQKLSVASEQKLSIAESSETSTSYYDAEMPSEQTPTEQSSFYSAMDIQDSHEILQNPKTQVPKTQPLLKAEQLLQAQPLPKTQPLSHETQPLMRAKPLQEAQPEQTMQTLPKTAVIKKKKKEKSFKLFKIFKSKKGRKMANKRVSVESAASGETSDDTIHVHSPSKLNLGSASWSTHAQLTSNRTRRDHKVKGVMNEALSSSTHADHTQHVDSPSESKLESDSWSHVNLPSEQDRGNSSCTTTVTTNVHRPSELQTGSWSHVDLPSKTDTGSSSDKTTEAVHVHSPSELHTNSWSHEDLSSRKDKGWSTKSTNDAVHMHSKSELQTDSWSRVDLPSEMDKGSLSDTTNDTVHMHSPSELQTDSWSHANLPSKKDRGSFNSTTTDAVHVYSPSELNLGTDSWSHINLPSDRNQGKSSGTDGVHLHSPSELHTDSWSHIHLPSNGNQRKPGATASDAIHMHSPSELHSDSWSTHVNTPSDGGNRSDSWEVSGIATLNGRPATTPSSTSEVSTTDASSVVSDKPGKRSLRKRLFHFVGLRKSGKSKSSRHPVAQK